MFKNKKYFLLSIICSFMYISLSKGSFNEDFNKEFKKLSIKKSTKKKTKKKAQELPGGLWFEEDDSSDEADEPRGS